MRRLVAAAVCAVALVAAGSVGTGCSDDSTEGEGVTNLEDVGPDINRLEAEVTALIEQIRELEARVAQLEADNPPPLR
jgi:outer membrane murein-binding lipoprotein Lpp